MTVDMEELTMNAWPARQTAMLGGWLLRLAEGFTKRANSVHPFYGGEESGESLQRKIAACEAFYGRAGQDTIFKMTPFAPDSLDRALEERGYVLRDPSRVMLLTGLAALRTPASRETGIAIECEPLLPYGWLANMCGYAGIPPQFEGSAARIMQSITMETGYFTLYAQGVPAAFGLAVMERGYVGLYDIVTAPNMRGRGYGERLLLHMLHWARKQGAVSSYLQVVRSNEPANRLYEKLNYKELYPYWYRVKPRASQ